MDQNNVIKNKKALHINSPYPEGSNVKVTASVKMAKITLLFSREEYLMHEKQSGKKLSI